MPALLAIIILGVLVWGFSKILSEAIILVCVAISRFLAKPAYIVIPGTLAWAASIMLLLFWLNMPAPPITPTPTPTACAGSDDQLSMLSPAERAYLRGCH